MAGRLSKPPVVNDTGISATEVIAVVLSIGWIAAVGIFFLVLPPSRDAVDSVDSLRLVMTLMAVFLPVAMIWVAAAAARSARIMREEAQRLSTVIDGMRETYIADRVSQQENGSIADRKQAELAKTGQTPDAPLATFASHRQATQPQPETSLAPPQSGSDDQQALALGTTAEDITPPLPRADLIRALNFPDTDKDVEGFAALRRALKDRNARHLIQASQDVLTLLSQDGIYMDDLRPDRAKPELWRRFASGERGMAMAALGGVRDRSSLALSAARMREDTIFRDAAHHFLRRFDQMLVGFEPKASDEEIVALAETRTARAFMLLGRVTGAFD